MCATFDSKPSLVSPEGTSEWQSLLFLYPMKTQFGNGSKLYPPKKMDGVRSSNNFLHLKIEGFRGTDNLIHPKMDV